MCEFKLVEGIIMINPQFVSAWQVSFQFSPEHSA
jgi:hypothetical protein